jgi:SAM-dependent methyltransferase
MSKEPSVQHVYQANKVRLEITIKNYLIRMLEALRIKEPLRVALYTPMVKAAIEAIPGLRRIYPPWGRSHPFDKFYGIDASGSVGSYGYGGSQAGVVRGALKALGDTRDYAFVDVGCGKGRVAIVASEFPFREITGIELSAELADIARRNVEKMSQRFPGRPPIAIRTGNALDFELPPGKSVLYMYHPFGREPMKRFATKLESALEAPDAPEMFVVYCNPVCGEVLDASPALSRWYADVIPYDPSEIGFGPEEKDAVVIWQSARHARPTPHNRIGRKIVVLEPLRAVLAD